MRLRLPDGTAVKGRVIDLASDSVAVDADEVVAAIRADGRADTPGAVRIDCSSPSLDHDRLGRVPISDPTPSRGWLLAAVGRPRGRRAPVADDLDRLEARLAEHRDRTAGESGVDDLERVDTPAAAPRQARHCVAVAGEDESRPRERVTTLRGRVNAHRDAGDDEATAAARQELVEAAMELSEVETERAAVEQRLSTLGQAGRAERDRRNARLKLEDAVENRRRDAWAYFAAELGAESKAVLRDLASLPAAAAPAVDSPPVSPAPESDPVACSLAAIRPTDLSAPVVLSRDRFSDAEAAVDWLDAPIVWCLPSD